MFLATSVDSSPPVNRYFHGAQYCLNHCFFTDQETCPLSPAMPGLSCPVTSLGLSRESEESLNTSFDVTDRTTRPRPPKTCPSTRLTPASPRAENRLNCTRRAQLRHQLVLRRMTGTAGTADRRMQKTCKINMHLSA